jgi:hypothetical protein
MMNIHKRFINLHRWTGREWLIGVAMADFTGAFFGVVWLFTGHRRFGLLQIPSLALTHCSACIKLTAIFGHVILANTESE